MSAGHIRRRGRNSWELKYDTADRTSGRKTAYKSFRGTRKEAQAELSRLLASIADGIHVDPNRCTVEQWLRDRLAQWRADGVISPKTAERYDGLIRDHIAPRIGSRPLQKLTTLDIEKWHSALLTTGRKGRNGQPDGQSGISARTVGHAHRILSKALAEGVRHGLVFKNVCTIQRAPRVNADEMQILNAQQVSELPAQLEGHPLAAPALVSLFTGMRRGEILALRWGNTDLEGKTIRVRESLEITKAGGLRFKPPKSKAGIRDVKLPSIVVDVLHAQRKRLLERRLLLGQGKLTEPDLVFPSVDGTPQQPDVFGAAWSKLQRALGLAVSFHGLRHTHASQLIDAGVDVVTISKRLGHSSPTVTLGIYAHLFQKDDAKAADAINAALKEQSR